MSIEEDAVPRYLTKQVKPAQNGRLEVLWRIYDALCNIPTGDLTDDQRRFVEVERRFAFQRYELEGDLMHQDGLQGKYGFAAIKKLHLKHLRERKKNDSKAVTRK